MIADNIYLYHLDAEVQKLYINKNQYNPRAVFAQFSNVTRIAFLLCKKSLFIPFSNYLESRIAFDIINFFAPLDISGGLNPLTILSTASDIRSALRKKEHEHGENYGNNPLFQYTAFEKQGLHLPGVFRTRKSSASKDIEKELLHSIGDDAVWKSFNNLMPHSVNYSQMEKQLADIPQLLSGRAFISEYMLPHLPIQPDRISEADRELNIKITNWYLKSFLSEIDAVCMTEIPYINASEILPTIEGKTHLSYQYYINRLRSLVYKRRFIFSDINAFQYISKCSTVELLEFKYSKEWSSIWEPESEKGLKIHNMNISKHSDIKIGIITALPKEYAAMEALLENVKPDTVSQGRLETTENFVIGEIPSLDGGKHKVALSLLPGMGNNFAAVVAAKMQLIYPSIEEIIVTGIAGGVPSEVRLGDIVVSTNGVIQYDFGKEEQDKLIQRDNGTSCSVFLLKAINLLRASEIKNGASWEKYIDRVINTLKGADYSRPSAKERFQQKKRTKYSVVERDPSTQTKLHFDKIASGNVVQKNPDRRDALNHDFSIIAIEMEASGIKDATRLSGNGYLAVRGICDYCDTQKNDIWQNYASAVAAAYTRALIESIPTETSFTQTLKPTYSLVTP